MVCPPSSPDRLRGVVVVVSAGPSPALAVRMAAEGAAVVVVSPDGTGAGAVAAEIRAAGGRADVVVTEDPPSPDDLEAAAEMVAEIHRP